MILAAGFPNVTYLGLPVLEQTFGSWARSVVIQIDLLQHPLYYSHWESLWCVTMAKILLGVGNQ